MFHEVLFVRLHLTPANPGLFTQHTLLTTGCIRGVLIERFSTIFRVGSRIVGGHPGFLFRIECQLKFLSMMAVLFYTRRGSHQAPFKCMLAVHLMFLKPFT